MRYANPWKLVLLRTLYAGTELTACGSSRTLLTEALLFRLLQ